MLHQAVLCESYEYAHRYVVLYGYVGFSTKFLEKISVWENIPLSAVWPLDFFLKLNIAKNMKFSFSLRFGLIKLLD